MTKYLQRETKPGNIQFALRQNLPAQILIRFSVAVYTFGIYVAVSDSNVGTGPTWRRGIKVISSFSCQIHLLATYLSTPQQAHRNT